MLVRKLFAPMLILPALAVVLSACGAQLTPYAARVGPATISTSTLDDALTTIANNTGYRCEILGGASGGSTLAIEGKGSGTYSTTFAADVLTQLVEYASAQVEVAKLGLHVTKFAETVAAAETKLLFAPTSSTGCAGSAASILSHFSASYLAEVQSFEVDDEVLSAHLAGATLTQAGIEAYGKAHPSVGSLACTSVIEVASKAEATTAESEIAKGESFATVAKQSSSDSSASNGGALGCVFPGQFTSPLNTVVASLPVGQVSAPVSFSSGYLILLVTSRPTAPASQIADELVAAQSTAFTKLITSAVEAHEVSIDGAYGTWAHTSAGWSVVTAKGPSTALVANPSAITPSAATLTSS